MRAPLEGAVALVTGASSGIGAAIARELAGPARALILVARRADRLEQLRAELAAARPGLLVEAVAADVTRADEVERVLARVEAAHGGVDILVNNAGFGDIGTLAQADWPKLERMIDLNIKALTYLTHRVVPAMVDRGRGGILMVGSTAGFQALPGFGVYSGTKFYVRGFSESLRAELRRHGVVVTQLCPGPVATEFAAVATDGADRRLPGGLEISAARCAREAVAGFRRGRAVVIPGALPRFAILLQGLTPAPVLRGLMDLVARRAGA